MINTKHSLKTKFLTLTASIIISLMLFSSIILLLKWREIIILKESETVLSISNTFAVTVVDALIFEEKSVFSKDNILETYIDNFINRLGNVKYVTIFDKNGSPILSRMVAPDKTIISGNSLKTKLKSFESEVVEIRNHKSNLSNFRTEWVNEVSLPFNFANKMWGGAVIGFDAQPIRTEISRVFFILLGATILITLIVLIILYLVINHLTSSLNTLVTEIDKIDLHSKLDLKIPVKDDEIGFLYKHFSLLISRLDSSKIQLENAQKQIYQAEKLASIGRLASGVAHQVNNPLNGIRSCLYAIKNEPENIEQTKEYISFIDEGISNIETVVKKLLGFARQQSKSENIINVNNSIEKVIQFFDFRLKEKPIKVIKIFSDEIPDIKADFHLFQEVIMNLLLNSYDAINTNGIIQIETDYINNQNPDYIKSDNCVVIKIKDNGCGIKEEHLSDIFEPFFTTKELGMGTGLGLSASQSIIEAHRGKILVESKEAEGTTFTILLPVN